jgi:hypothetical protein
MEPTEDGSRNNVLGWNTSHGRQTNARRAAAAYEGRDGGGHGSKERTVRRKNSVPSRTDHSFLRDFSADHLVLGFPPRCLSKS